MKRMGIRMSVLALIVALLLGGSCLAEAVEYNPSIDTLSITCAQCKPGSDYSLLIVEGDEFGDVTQDSLLYVDQLTANSSGELFVAFVSPAFPSCTIALGGEFEDGQSSPLVLGQYSPATPPQEDYDFVLPSMLTAIESEAFVGCAFTHVLVGQSVERIGSRAFADSESLVYISIPDATRDIADDAFSGSEHVVIACHANSYAQQYAQRKGIEVKIIE